MAFYKKGREKLKELHQEQDFVQLRHGGFDDRLWRTNELGSFNRGADHLSNCWEGTSLQRKKGSTLAVRCVHHLCCYLEPATAGIPKPWTFLQERWSKWGQRSATSCFSCDLYSAKWLIALLLLWNTPVQVLQTAAFSRPPLHRQCPHPELTCSTLNRNTQYIPSVCLGLNTRASQMPVTAFRMEVPEYMKPGLHTWYLLSFTGHCALPGTFWWDDRMGNQTFNYPCSQSETYLGEGMLSWQLCPSLL